MESAHPVDGRRGPPMLVGIRVPRAVLVVYGGVAVVAITLRFLDPAGAKVVGSAGILLTNLAAAVVFVVRARGLPSQERRAWTLVGLGLGSGVLGIAVMAVMWLATGTVPAFGPADVVFLLGYAVALAGFASLPHTSGTGWHRLRVALDGLIGAVSLGTVIWVAVLSPVLPRLDEAPLWERIVGSLYPLLDVAVFVVLMIVTVRRSSYRFDLRLLLFGAGVLAQVLGDVSYLVSGVGRSFADAEPNFGFYLAAAAAFLTVALVVDRSPEPREYAERRIPVWAMILPYSAAVVMVLLLVFHVVTDGLGDTDRPLLLATTLVGLLVAVRQGAAIREARVLVERERATLVSSISHELRTPLTSLVGFLDLLEDGEGLSDAERAEMVGIVREQALYMSRIVSDLLMLSRDRPEDLQVEVASVEVEAMLRTAVSACGQRPEAVLVDVEPGLRALVDPHRIRQAVINLLVNATRYGGPTRLVEARHGRGAALVIAVHDDGPGVPRRYELAVWERFERGAHRYDARIPGSGIGLAIVAAVARAHGGVATYRRSERLGGACFALELPGRVLEEPDADVPAAASGTREGTPRPRQRT